MRRYLFLALVLSVGIGLDQASKMWADARLGTEEHPVRVEASEGDEAKTLADLVEEQHNVDPARLDALTAAGFRAFMRFEPALKVRPEDPAFAPNPATGRRGLSYWVFHHERLDSSPRRLPRAAEIMTDSSQFHDSTIGEYLHATLEPGLGPEKVGRILEDYVFAVDYTRALPSDPAEPGQVYLLLDRVVTVIPGFLQLQYAENPGAAWGFLSSLDAGLRRTFFQVVTILALCVLMALFHRLHAEDRVPAWALAAFLAGAIGNFIDRIRFNHVIDFVDIYIGTLHWPTFNVADVFITFGAALLIIEAVVRRDRSYLLLRRRSGETGST